jgi:hypothetical protein
MMTTIDEWKAATLRRVGSDGAICAETARFFDETKTANRWAAAPTT